MFFTTYKLIPLYVDISSLLVVPKGFFSLVDHLDAMSKIIINLYSAFKTVQSLHPSFIVHPKIE